MISLLLTLVAAQAAGIQASSTQKDDNGPLSASLAVDGLLGTGWAEGADSSGAGEWLDLDLGRTTQLSSLSIWPGNLSKGKRSFREYSRPKTIRVLIDGTQQGDPIRIEDAMARVDVPLNITGRKVRVTVDEVHEGMVFTDMYIAELAVNFPGGGPISRVDNWLNSKEAKRMHAVYLERLNAAYVTHKEAEFGDKAAFAYITQAAAEGPDYLRSRVKSLAPAGYRAQALRTSRQACKAIRKLKDPNGIAALELASLRATGEDQAELAETVEIFYAYQQMIGGGNPNVRYWGEPGWSPGALQSFGEPLAMEMDQTGQVYIADTGNNRLQRFGPDGRPDRQWGGDPDLASAWFALGRPWYVSGARPGEGPGEFNNPLDVTVIPGKEADGFATVDAQNRVQIFDAQGRATISWQVETKNRPEPGLGGQGYIEWIPKAEQLVVIIQDEAIVYSLKAEEVGRWKVVDGAPSAVTTSSAGQLLMAIAGKVVQYHPTGHRYGTVIGESVLGRGFEEMGLTIDEKGKLWLLTDTGWVYRFKRVGKASLKVRAIERPIAHPRIVVREGILFYSSDDRIEQIDVLQTKMDQEQAAEDKEQD